MNSAAKDIVDILGAESSIALTPGVNLFYARMADTPDTCAVVYDTPGAPPQLTLKKDTSNLFYVGVSIHVRAVRYEEAFIISQSIVDFLHGESNIVQDGTLYQLFKAVNNPHLLHFDKNERPVFLINFDVVRI